MALATALSTRGVRFVLGGQPALIRGEAHVTGVRLANNTEIDVIWDRYQEALEPLRQQLTRREGRANVADTPEPLYESLKAYLMLAQAAEIAPIVTFLASDESIFATGNAYMVDGGMTI